VSTVQVPVSGGSLVAWREGTGEPVLVLHGGPALSDYTAELAAELRPEFETTRYQQRGLPPSVETGPFDVDTNVADAVAVLDALSDRPLWVAGHSWGGLLALYVAVSRPDRVRGLLLIDPAGAVGDGGVGALDEELGRRHERHYGRPMEETVTLRELWPLYFADPHKAPAMPHIDGRVEARHETWQSDAAHRERGTLVRGLPELAMPVIFVHGLLDPLPVSVSVETAALIPNAATHLIEACGHFPWIEHPGRIGDIAKAAIRGSALRSGPA
jgi:pimeloyl-ACP methyl ester carboxylesterase